MRVVSIWFALLVFPAALSAQPAPCVSPQTKLLRFDPYNPSHLAIVRNYGGTMLAQAPLSALLELDPYVPTEAALLRQLGGAIPVWSYPAYPWYAPTAPSAAAPPCEPVREPEASPITSFHEMLQVLPPSAPAARSVTGVTGPRTGRGISIQYGGRQWASDGPAVRFDEQQFALVGEQAGLPIFRRSGGDDDVIYIRTLPGMVAPFRVVRPQPQKP
jgi:hypothetical protein